MSDGAIGNKTHASHVTVGVAQSAREDDGRSAHTMPAPCSNMNGGRTARSEPAKLTTHACELDELCVEGAGGKRQSCQDVEGYAKAAKFGACSGDRQHGVCPRAPRQTGSKLDPVATYDEEMEGEEEGRTLGNGCGEAMSVLSSDADNVGLRGNEVSQCAVRVTANYTDTTTASRSAHDESTMQWTSHALSQSQAGDTMAPRLTNAATTALVGAVDGPPASSRQRTTRFARQVLHVIRHRNFAETTDSVSQGDGESLLTRSPHGSRRSTALPPTPPCGASDMPDCAVRGAVMRDDVVVPPSAALTFAQPAVDFDIAAFAPFFALAIREIVTECERRVANAPAASRAAQTRHLRGSHNQGLSVSSHSFDQPPMLANAMPSHPLPLTFLPTHRESDAVYATRSYPCPSCLAAQTKSNRGDLPEAAHTPLFAHGITLQMTSGEARGSIPPYLTSGPSATARRAGWSGEDYRAVMPRHALIGATPQPCETASPAHTRTSGEADSEATRGGGGAMTEVVCKLLKSLGQYLSYGGAAPMVFIAALAYLAGVTTQCASDYASVTWSNWYRLTTTAILVASKMYNEHGSRRLNAYFAQASGIALAELNRQELDFLYLVDFDLLLAERDVQGWLTWMEQLALKHHMMTPLQHLLPQCIVSTYSSCTATSVCQTASLLTTGACGGGAHRMDGNAPQATTPLKTSNARNNHSDSSMGGIAAMASWSGLPGSRRSSWLTAANADCSATASYMSQDCLPPPNADRAGSCHTSPYVPSISPSLLSVNGASNLSTQLRDPVPPSPIHGVVRHGYARERLFSVVHGSDGPPSPRTVRQLVRCAPSTPPIRAAAARPAPPSPQKDSPPSFFRRDAATVARTTMDQSRGVTAAVETMLTVSTSTYVAAATAAATLTKKRPTVIFTNSPEGVRAMTSATIDAAPAMTESLTRDEPAAPRQHQRWRPSFAVVQRVRDVLGVTASLVRGRLNVLATDEPAEALSPFVQNAARRPCTGTTAAVLPASVIEGPTDARGVRRECDAPEEEDEEDEEGYYDEYDNYIYYDEEDIGYYDPSGQFHYFDEEEENNCAAEEDGEGQLGVTPPRRLPLTHSPPSL